MVVSPRVFLQLLVVIFSITTSLSQVPKNATFKFVNEGEFGDRIIEYDASYRVIRDNVQTFYAHPFRLCFYNTTPSAYIFAIRAGVPNDEDLMRWVWDANRNNPVGENSTLTLGQNGNLVIAEADGRVVWQTNTANKGVTGMQMLPNGNLVLHDRKGNFIWQSFDFPVDTLLRGQSLKLNGVNKLVSRTSEMDGSDGPYSLILEKNGMPMYINKTGTPLVYGGWFRRNDLGNNVTFNVEPERENATAYELLLTFIPNESPPTRRLLQTGSRPIGSGGQINLNKVNYNATVSYLRLYSDGSLKASTYYDDAEYLKWDETFSFFSTYFIRRCGQPSLCGTFGLCDAGMCVACPSPKGLLGWSRSCEPPKLPQCGSKGNKVNYYKIVGVEHFLGPFLKGGDGPMKLNECREKCNRDCKCLGFFYEENTSKCLVAPLLGTLIKDVNTSVGYIKYS